MIIDMQRYHQTFMRYAGGIALKSFKSPLSASPRDPVDNTAHFYHGEDFSPSAIILIDFYVRNSLQI